MSLNAIPDSERGLYAKYHVSRVDGKPKGPYFVLAYGTDPHALLALQVYANLVRGTHPLLADDLDKEVARFKGTQDN